MTAKKTHLPGFMEGLLCMGRGYRAKQYFGGVVPQALRRTRVTAAYTRSECSAS